MPNRVDVQGLVKFRRDLKLFDVEAADGLKKELRAVGDLVRADAQDRFEGVSPKSAAGYRVYLRSGGRVSVEQSLRKTTGRHPEFGALQMRTALLPALADKEAEAFALVESMLTMLADRV